MKKNIGLKVKDSTDNDSIINVLPDDLLKMILGFLSDADCIKNRLVSKRFEKVANDVISKRVSGSSLFMNHDLLPKKAKNFLSQNLTLLEDLTLRLNNKTGSLNEIFTHALFFLIKTHFIPDVSNFLIENIEFDSDSDHITISSESDITEVIKNNILVHFVKLDKNDFFKNNGYQALDGKMKAYLKLRDLLSNAKSKKSSFDELTELDPTLSRLHENYLSQMESVYIGYINCLNGFIFAVKNTNEGGAVSYKIKINLPELIKLYSKELLALAVTTYDYSNQKLCMPRLLRKALVYNHFKESPDFEIQYDIYKYDKCCILRADSNVNAIHRIKAEKKQFILPDYKNPSYCNGWYSRPSYEVLFKSDEYFLKYAYDIVSSDIVFENLPKHRLASTTLVDESKHCYDSPFMIEMCKDQDYYLLINCFLMSIAKCASNFEVILEMRVNYQKKIDQLGARENCQLM